MKKIFYIVPKDIIIGAFIVLILACNVEEIIGIVIFAIWILYIVLGIAKISHKILPVLEKELRANFYE